MDELAPLPEAPKARKAPGGAQRFCPQCGSPCTSDDRFCGSCGKAIKALATAMICAALLFVIPTAHAADRGEFRGRVMLVNEKGSTPQAGVTVQLAVFKEGSEIAGARAKTDARGTYRFPNLDRAPGFVYQVAALYESVPFELPRTSFGVQERFELPDIQLYPVTADPKDLSVDEVVLLEFSKTDLLKVNHSLFFTNLGAKAYNPAGTEGRPVEVALMPGGFQLHFSGESAGRADLVPGESKLRLTSPVKPGADNEVSLEFNYLLPVHTRSVTFDLPFSVDRRKSTVALANRDLSVKSPQLQRQASQKQGNDTLFIHATSAPVKAGESLTFTVSGLSLPGDTARTLAWIGLALSLVVAVGLALRKAEVKVGRDATLEALRSLNARFTSGRLTLPLYRAERARLREKLLVALLPDDDETRAA